MNAIEKGKLYDLRAEGMTHARWSMAAWKEYETAVKAGDSVKAEVQQRLADQDRGYALAIADVLATLKCGGKEIHNLLGE